MKSLPSKQFGKVLDFIEQHLNENVTVDTIAAIGNYSPFHFLRLFKAYTGETILELINRKRLEKVVALLIRERKLTVGELALRYGFSGNAALSKAFKKRYGVSPSAFRKQSSGRYDKIKVSRNGQIFPELESYLCHIRTIQKWSEMNATISLQEINPFYMVYINHIGVDHLDDAFYKIINWTLQKELADPDTLEVIRFYHDSFKITAPEKVRMEIGVKIKREIEKVSEVFYKKVLPGKCVTGDFEIDPSDFEKAWSAMYVWMNENGFTPTEALPFEIIRNNYNEHPQKKCIVSLHIPVKRKE